MAGQDLQWRRKVSLLLVQGEQALDLSEFRFTFETVQADFPSPNNCAIRVYNLSAETMSRVPKEFGSIVLQAGYEGTGFGVVFQGTVMQWQRGKEGPLQTYLGILCADGDIAYNHSVVNKTLAAGSSAGERVQAITDAMAPNGVKLGHNGLSYTGGVLPRGKVLFGLARARLNSETQTNGATWNISAGKVNIIPLDGYLPGEAVVLTSATGLIGRPEQTEEGLKLRCLLNPRIQPGALIKVDNNSINTTTSAATNPAGLAYNQWAKPQFFADITADGLYRVIVAEHRGDTRGNDFYTDVVALALDPSTNKVKPYG